MVYVFIIWLPQKLERAIQWLKKQPEDIPALFCSQTQSIDENDNLLAKSPLFSRKPSFQNALVQNIAGGNTMVFNQAARNLLREAGTEIDAASHDWWTYLLITACGGAVYTIRK